MDATHGRLRALVEWTVAVGLLLSGVAIGLNLSGQLERVVPVTPVTAHQRDVPPTPPSVPPRAVSVPILDLTGDVRIQVGDAAGDALHRLQGLVVAGANGIERLASGERVTHEFLYSGVRFHVITESRAKGAQVTGIFVGPSMDR